MEFAEAAGFFKEANLEVEPFYTDGGAATLTTVLSGSADIGLSNGLLGVIGAYVKGAPVQGDLGADDRRGRALLVRARRERHQEPEGCGRKDGRVFLARLVVEPDLARAAAPGAASAPRRSQPAARPRR